MILAGPNHRCHDAARMAPPKANRDDDRRLAVARPGGRRRRAPGSLVREVAASGRAPCARSTALERGREIWRRSIDAAVGGRPGAQGDRPGPLFGVPITIKDTSRSRTEDATASPDAHVIEREDARSSVVIDAGAVIVGAPTPRVSMRATTNNALYADPNPWDAKNLCGDRPAAPPLRLPRHRRDGHGNDVAGSIRCHAARRRRLQAATPRRRRWHPCRVPWRDASATFACVATMSPDRARHLARPASRAGVLDVERPRICLLPRYRDALTRRSRRPCATPRARWRGTATRSSPST